MHFRDDGLRALDHFLRGATREGQHENARRIHAVQHQVSGTVRQRIGLSRAGAGEDEQRARGDALSGTAVPNVAARRC